MPLQSLQYSYLLPSGASSPFLHEPPISGANVRHPAFLTHASCRSGRDGTSILLRPLFLSLGRCSSGSFPIRCLCARLLARLSWSAASGHKCCNGEYRTLGTFFVACRSGCYFGVYATSIPPSVPQLVWFFLHTLPLCSPVSSPCLSRSFHSDSA